jgi:predicted PurR-regulated permease PerM
MESNNHKLQNYEFSNIVDALIRLGVLFFLISWCIDILRPFILLLIWAVVIAIALFPVQTYFIRLFRGRRTLATISLVLILLSFLIVPSFMIMHSLFEGISHLKITHETGKHLIPPPGETTAQWPAIAKPVIDLWKMASENIQGVTVKYSEQLKSVITWLISALAGFGKGIVFFVVSIIISGVMLAYSESLSKTAKIVFIKLAGKNGEHFASVTVHTIRNVVKGVLGVALIQSVMAGLGFFIAGVPFAGLWTVACLVLAVVQIGAAPVVIPIAIYMFSVTDTMTAVLLTIWLLLTTISDNVLKPILLGRNAPAPMLVIFLGAIGGFIMSGFLGLFLGAVILTIGYKITLLWLTPELKQE